MKIKSTFIVIPLLLSGCSATTELSNKMSDWLYPLFAISPDSVCEGYHFHVLEGAPPKSGPLPENDLHFFYLLSSTDSYNADKALGRYLSIMGDEASLPTRYPAVYKDEWLQGAKWGMAMSDLGIPYSDDVIEASYQEFIYNSHESSVDKELSMNGVNPRIFRELVSTEDYEAKLFSIESRISQSGIESVPAIVIKNEYAVYPQDFDDQRDAWMTAHYLLNGSEHLSLKCQ